MATKKKTASKKGASKKSEVNYKEFKFTGKTFEYSGRIYAPTAGKGKIIKSYGMNLCLNGVITIKGVRLVETESNIFLTYPQYVNQKEEYVPYIYVDKELNSEMDDLVTYLMKLLGIDSEEEEEEEEFQEGTGNKLPF